MSRVEVIGDATLYLGDCLEILPTLPKVDAVITDPPYGIAELWDVQRTSARGDSVLCDGGARWDDETNKRAVLAAIERASKAIIWGGNYYPLPPSRGYLVWDKMQKFSGADSELAWCSWPLTPRTFRYARAQLAHHETKLHPTQKPLPLMLWCIEQAGTPATILDPFMGSGTTGVAATQAACKFIGVEREPKYFDIACRRIEQAYKQRPLFEAEPQPKPQQMEIGNV